MTQLQTIFATLLAAIRAFFTINRPVGTWQAPKAVYSLNSLYAENTFAALQHIPANDVKPDAWVNFVPGPKAWQAPSMSYPVDCNRRCRLASLLKQTADAHHVYEQSLGHKDADWPTWYAAYMTRNGGAL